MTTVSHGPRAVNYSDGGDRRVSLIVIHSAETPEGKRTARALNKWASGQSGPAPRASWHYAVDAETIESSVPLLDIAWHAGHRPTNVRSVGIELAGRASQTREEWLDAYSLGVLANAARITATCCGLYAIPPFRLSPAQVAAGEAGICGHVDVTRAFEIGGGHKDPGDGFPWDLFLRLVSEFLAAG